LLSGAEHDLPADRADPDPERAAAEVWWGMSPGAAHAESELPDIDDRLVEPETPYEMLDGELVYVSPADPPHGKLHLQLAALIEAHTGFAFEAAADLLTRTSKRDDVAPDVSVYPDAPHPETGGRQLEQLAFEIVSTESLRHAARNAAKLTRRGVRRVFAIDVERARVLEWSTARRGWRELDASGHIEDPALEVPLPIEAIIHAAKADDAVARALLARHNPVLEARLAERHDEGVREGRARGVEEGRARGVEEGLARGIAHAARALADAVLAVLAVRGIAVGEAERARIVDERDLARLKRWLIEAATCSEAHELWAMTGGV
jgi:Uma2 family endonuclease